MGHSGSADDGMRQNALAFALGVSVGEHANRRKEGFGEETTAGGQRDNHWKEGFGEDDGKRALNRAQDSQNIVSKIARCSKATPGYKPCYP